MENLISLITLIVIKDELCTKETTVGSPQIPSIILEEAPTAPSIDEKFESTSRKIKRMRKNSEPRYGFFDYSMIPDKDPRFFARSKSTSPDEGLSKED